MTGRASANIPKSLRDLWKHQDEHGRHSTTDNMSSAKAIVSHDTHANGGWKLEDVTVRKPGDGELLVEMVATGVCHTDALIGGIPDGASPVAFYPRVLGHEGSGYVKEVGSNVTVAKVGDPVLLSYAFCNECPACKSNGHSHCPDFTELNFTKNAASPIFTPSKGGEQNSIHGAFFGQSSFASLSIVRACSVVNAKDLIKSKEDLQLFAPLGCGIQTGAGTVINAAKATKDDIVCIMGLGGVGLSAIMAAKIQGSRIIIGVDRVQSRLELAKELGATHVVDGSALKEGQSLTDAIKALSEDLGPTVVIDTTGAPPLIQAGFDSARNKGRVIQVGSSPFDFNMSINMFAFMMRGVTFSGAIEGQAYPPEFVPKMVQWYRDGKFPVDKLVKFMAVDKFEQALEEMHSGKTIKPILTY
ncbi:hypothetical protein B0A48_01325 [Cryoendolithus antarcticus]|uniref:Enoyl reductase (ER) domain-containing protein n=1 Tax=Cryoendolithus antarcticus TaxID=1507870 RepID=A0A1V8TT02_9PEZI|nr:hypothetical protein B0A48_01325 [Cryoendolithus antarcticus]